MGRGRPWSEEDIGKAVKLRAGGMSAAEIGRTLDRTPAAVWDMLHRMQPVSLERSVGTPIWKDQEDVRFANDAIRGSAKLLAEIERVFGAAA